MNKEEVIPLKKEEQESQPQESQAGDFAGTAERTFNESLNRVLYPINTPLTGRGVKNRDIFTLSGLISASATVTTVSTDSHGVTETNLATFTFLPEEWHVGMVVRITAFGTYISDGTRTVTLRVGTGTAPTTEWNSIASTAASTTNQPWHLEWYGIVGTIGASGTLEAQMRGKINNVNKDDANTAAVTLATNASRLIALTAQWSASTAGNSITIRQFLVEVLN